MVSLYYNSVTVTKGTDNKTVPPTGMIAITCARLKCLVIRPEVRLRGTSQRAESELWKQQGSIHYFSPWLHIRTAICSMSPVTWALRWDFGSYITPTVTKNPSCKVTLCPASLQLCLCGRPIHTCHYATPSFYSMLHSLLKRKKHYSQVGRTGSCSLLWFRNGCL